MRGKTSKFTTEQEEEIVSLIVEGCTNLDIVDLVAEKYGMTSTLIINKIGYIKRQFRAQGNKIPRAKRTPKVKPEVAMPESPIVKMIEERKKEEPDDARLKRLAKIKITAIKKAVPNVTFPLIAKYVKNNTNQIVLFTSLHRGVVLHPSESTLYAGYVNENFAACTDSEYWEILDEVTLTFYS